MSLIQDRSVLQKVDIVKTQPGEWKFGDTDKVVVKYFTMV
jgi:hypothetical protein